jgi:hypothetical protein
MNPSLGEDCQSITSLMRLNCTVQIYLLHLFPSLTILSMYLKWKRIDDVIISLHASINL